MLSVNRLYGQQKLYIPYISDEDNQKADRHLIELNRQMLIIEKSGLNRSILAQLVEAVEPNYIANFSPNDEQLMFELIAEELCGSKNLYKALNAL